MKKLCLALIMLLAAASASAGAWGTGSFENDDALDWVGECVHSPNGSVIAAVLNNALTSKVIESGDGATAMAAMEVVAASLGRPSKQFPAELRAWLANQSTSSITTLAPLARKLIVRIRDSKVSELKQLWSEEQPERWEAHVAELASRLGRP